MFDPRTDNAQKIDIGMCIGLLSAALHEFPMWSISLYISQRTRWTYARKT